MKLLFSIMAFTMMVSLHVECQPSADSRSNWYNYFFEMLNPVWRHHRARIRPYAGQLGSPVINIRGSRSIKTDPIVLQSRAECIYGDEEVYCAGIDMKSEESNVKCDAKIDMAHIDLKDLKRFALSELRILSTGEGSEPEVKLYMYAQRENSTKWSDYRAQELTINGEKKDGTERQILSLHSAKKVDDKGLTVLDHSCWIKMVNFFKTLKNVDTIQVEKETITHKKWQDSVKVIANLRLL